MSDIDNLKGAEFTHKLETSEVFNDLIEHEAKDGIHCRAYAHCLSRACWHGGRIILRQTSPESEGVFDFILELHKGPNGQWDELLDSGVTQEHLNIWLEFASMFLSNPGNHYVRSKISAMASTPWPDVTEFAKTFACRMMVIGRCPQCSQRCAPENSSYVTRGNFTALGDSGHDAGSAAKQSRIPSETSRSSYYPSKEMVNHKRLKLSPS